MKVSIPFRTYEPPAFVERELRDHDPSLALRWNQKIQRWQLMRKMTKNHTRNPGRRIEAEPWDSEWYEWVIVMTVSEPDKSYRHPDRRLIEMVRRGDAWNRDWRDILREIDEHNEAVQQERERKLDDAVAGSAGFVQGICLGRQTHSYERASAWPLHEKATAAA